MKYLNELLEGKEVYVTLTHKFHPYGLKDRELTQQMSGRLIAINKDYVYIEDNTSRTIIMADKVQFIEFAKAGE